MALYAAQGVAVTVVALTGGERGDVLNPALDNAETRANMTAIRRAELEASCAILGATPRWLGYEDSGFTLEEPWEDLPPGSLAAADIRQSAARLADMLVDERPDVLVTYDESGGYPHPDHVMCHRVSMKAYAYAGDTERYGERAWVVPKVYYQMGFLRARWVALAEAMAAQGLDFPMGWRLEGPDYDPTEHRVTTRIECGAYFDRRAAALRAHATQVDPTGWWFAIPLEIQQAAWGWEDYELVRSTVPVTLPETDLFAGLRP
jgi:mycothiol S-conjugate amidase